jgi:hypothetical protein
MSAGLGNGVEDTATMFTPQMIKDRLRGTPFLPLQIVLSTGEKYEVRHPDLVWVGEREIQVGTPSHKGPGIYKSSSRVALLHIVELRDLETPVNPQGDGNPS